MAEEVARAQIMVIALDQTMMALRARAEGDWQKEIETLARLREATVARVQEIDPSVEFDAPAAV